MGRPDQNNPPGTWSEGRTSWRTAPRPRGWKTKITPRILARDPACTLRTHCYGAPSTEVDHIGDPEDHSDDNLRGVCGDCHRARTARQGAAASVAARRRRTAKRKPQKHPGLIS